MRFCLILLSAICLLQQPHSANSAEQPNVVVLLADDLGWSDLGCFGSGETRTPQLDQLAQQGTRFDNFYAACAVCSPSRAALLTGRVPVRVGVYSWIHTSHRMHLRVEEVTIAELLQAQGYQTAHFGKWHLSYDLETGSGPNPDPGDHGFDTWMATGNNANPSHFQPDNFVKNGKTMGQMEGYSCDLVVQEALQFLQERDMKRPFYLNLWFHEPHARVAAPPELTERHQGKKNPAYYGSIENMDQAIGRLLDKLSALNLRDNTLIVFTSDNGSYMAGSNGPLKGRKTELWEGGIRVPAIFVWPGIIPAGRLCKMPAGIVDILPTICQATGLDPPQDRVLDGISLFQAFGKVSQEREKPLYWFYSPSRPVCVMRDGDWCLTADPTLELPRDNLFSEQSICNIKQTDLTNFRLYSLSQDPQQSQDLSGTHPEILNTLRTKMLEIHRGVVAEAHDWREK